MVPAALQERLDVRNLQEVIGSLTAQLTWLQTADGDRVHLP